MSKIEIVILAAGKGSRMKSRKPKLLNKISGKSIIEHTINKAQKIKNSNINIIINRDLEVLKKKFKDINFIKQDRAQGTGHAIKTYLRKTKKFNDILIMMGDAPFIDIKDLEKVVKGMNNHPIVVLGGKLKKNDGNGVIILNKKKIKEIREYKLLKKKDNQRQYFNTGIFGVKNRYLKLFFNLKKNKILNEYLITDILSLAYKKKIPSKLVKTKKKNTFGINTLKELNEIKKIF